jgi:hypothetical protein
MKLASELSSTAMSTAAKARSRTLEASQRKYAIPTTAAATSRRLK